MKKLLSMIILPLAIVTLSGCVLYNGRNKDGSPKSTTTTSTTTSEPSTSGSDTSSSEPVPPAPQGSVNLYLVLGPNGTYEDAPGTDYDAKFLVNTKLVTVSIGSDLPGADIVKSTVNGSTFLHWVNRDTTEIVVKAPEVESILVAVYQGGESKPGDDENLPTSGFGFLFSDNRYALATKCTGNEEQDDHGRKQYKIPNMDFIKDEQFRLFNFEKREGWVIDLDPWSLGGTSDSDTKWMEYLNKGSSTYTVLKNFNAKDIYIKLKFEDDQLYMGLAK